MRRNLYSVTTIPYIAVPYVLALRYMRVYGLFSLKYLNPQDILQSCHHSNYQDKWTRRYMTLHNWYTLQRRPLAGPLVVHHCGLSIIPLSRFRDISYIRGYPLKSHFQIPCVFPVYSLSNRKFSLCQFT